MDRRTISRLAATLALAALSPMAAGAQGAPTPPTLALSAAVDPTPGRAALKPLYHVRLTSTWPQEATGDGCRNGGEETIEGRLARDADGSYAGTFTRRTELLFCGAHGAREGAPASACALTLTGRGVVDATGVVMGDGTSPTGQEMRLVWTPAAGHAATVSGDCAPAFKEAVKQMYLSTPHAAEFPLTSAGAGPRTERLENYAWKVELE
ncbi:MAG: hypothetical protein ABJC36_02540 [Gemmatimonadales bacterium]